MAAWKKLSLNKGKKKKKNTQPSTFSDKKS